VSARTGDGRALSDLRDFAKNFDQLLSSTLS
jgi:hypothetical protein